MDLRLPEIWRGNNSRMVCNKDERACLQQQALKQEHELMQVQAEAIMTRHAEHVLEYFERIEKILNMNTGAKAVMRQNSVSLSIQKGLPINQKALDTILGLFEEQTREPEVRENKQLFTRMFYSVMQWAEPLLATDLSVVHQYCLVFADLILPVAKVDTNSRGYHVYRELQSKVRVGMQSEAAGRLIIHRAIDCPEPVPGKPLNSPEIGKYYTAVNEVQDVKDRVRNGDKSPLSMDWSRDDEDLR